MFERSRPRPPISVRILLWGTLFFLYVPLLFMLLKAFRYTNVQGNSYWSLEWFRQLWQDPGLIPSLENSLRVSFTSSLMSTFLGLLAALSLYKNKSISARLLEIFSMVSLVLPEIVFALSLLAWFFLLHWPLGLNTVIVAHVTFSISFVILTIQSRLSQLDEAYFDAARDLGASGRQIFFKIKLPLLKPAILSGFVLSFLISFDDFLITFFVNGVGTDTLPVKLYSSLRTGLSPKLNALSCVMLFVTAIFLSLLFRYNSFRALLNKHDQ